MHGLAGELRASAPVFRGGALPGGAKYQACHRPLLLLVCSCLAVTAGSAMGCSSRADTEPTTGTDGSTAGRAQLNDVSVLYPLATTESGFESYLSASASTRGGVLLPQTLYEGAESEFWPGSYSAPTQSALDTIYGMLRMVAFRLDPCFANIGPITEPSHCQAQIRLVLQPLSYANGSTTAGDGAVHAFYSLSTEDFESAVRAVIAARESISGSADLGPLAVHPIMARQGPDGQMAHRLNSLVTQYAGASNLVRVTVLNSASVPAPPRAAHPARIWNFHGYDVVGGTLEPLVIPALPSGSTSVNFSAAADPLVGAFLPPSVSSDNMQTMADATRFDAASAAVQTSAFDAALRIENPDFNSPNTIDCASCHLARPSRDLVAAKRGFSAANNPNAFSADPRYVPCRDMALTTSNDGTALNVHAFSYLGGQPMINARVINESASIMTYLNTRVLP